LAAIGTGTQDSPALVSVKNDWRNVSWRLDIEYTASDDVLAYAGISTGFKSGGITISPSGSLDDFGPEDLTAYETGIKAQWLDHRLALSAAAFYYDFQDLQVDTFTVTATGLLFETDNAARAELYGIDMDGSFRISDRLLVSGGLVWLPKREFVEYRNDRTGDTLSGNQLARAPEWTATTAIRYKHPLQGYGSFSARLEYNYRSDFFYTTDNDPRFAQGNFGLLNIYLDLERANEKWYIFASGRNLGNVDYFNQVFLQSSPGYPDTYEAGFGYRF
jgi:iron complex outermembrane receptor protein